MFGFWGERNYGNYFGGKEIMGNYGKFLCGILYVDDVVFIILFGK